ncbi:uncharacterized protein TRAVEDRAFT_143156 [Trametes versicolor FP-101664 SS1]|uniref:uncharacterized protein n=1 Tax=Trametes versicolor (strain FP-101664) TaxID=717944 RepID=UPI00046221B4|nr:uncharacterized protein TRAVEDRAFT_143156 [Trametes versicolor FP-101664 SS1]EIW61422.1 hypothetical protein TRAVEDRAFT_143156 [Trametes versicolor FP-101664 SS1]
MPAPAVYIAFAVVGVVAVGVAFHELVYEPHIAPKFEEWAESFLEKRRQRQRNRQRTGSVLAHSHPFEGSENGARRSADSGQDRRDDEDNNDTAIELEQLAARERDAWRREAASSGLRQRRPVGAMDDSNPSIPYPAMSPTHVLFDTSEPPSPGVRSSSSLSSAPSSLNSSPSHPIIELSEPQPRVAEAASPPPRGMSRGLPTPMSNFSPLSSRAATPSTTLSDHSVFSSRRPTPDISASQALTSAYNTPLGGSVISDCGRPVEDIQSLPGSRIQSPFSDIHSVDARSTPEHVFARSPITSPRVQSPSIGSDLTMDSDDEFDILSPRSGMFSPPSRVGDFHFDGASDASWMSAGRRTPEF